MGYSRNARLDWDDLAAKFPAFGDAGRWLPLFQRHFALLTEAAPSLNTTRVGADEAPARLYGESLETFRIALLHADGPVERYVDVGSGGGFPGMVAAIVFPEWTTTLIEAHGRKAAFLGQIAEELGLPNVTSLHLRAEEAGRGPLRDSADLVTLRAVAYLRVALEYVAPLARTGATIAMPKGSMVEDEERESVMAARELGVDIVAREKMRRTVSMTPWTLVLRKLTATPERYPRRPGVPTRRPL